VASDQNLQSAEARLLEGCLEGDPDSWREFVETYSPLILQVIRATLRRFEAGHRASESEEDLHQTVFMALWEGNRRRLRSFEGRRRSSLATWLRVVVANLVIDQLRKTKPAAAPLAEEVGQEAGCAVWLANPGPGADHEMVNRQAVEMLRQELASLGEQERLVLKLRCLDGRSGREAAQVLGIDRNHVDQILHRARKKLRQRLENAGAL
jgi:RNA polymerase sigma-70 factor (ECF subfamily)